MGRHQGMADAGREQVGADGARRVGRLPRAGASRSTSSRPSRLPGWRAHEICVHLGCWDDHTALADLIASARDRRTGTPPDVDAVNARVTAAHRDASREEVLAALRRNREATARYLADEPVELDTAPTVSVVGRLPLLSVVLGPGLRARRPRPGPGVLRRPAARRRRAAVRPRRARRRDRRAGRVDGHHRRGHPGHPRRRLGLRRRRRTAGPCARCRPARTTGRRSRRRPTCCSRRRRAGSTRCPPSPAAG